MTNLLKGDRKTVQKVHKQTMSDLLRSWHMPDYIVKMGKRGLRYQTPPEKGIFWYYFSLFIRQRDVKKYGTCISCGRPITVETSDCGHFIAAGKCGRDLLFDERNNNAECSHCNAWDDMHLIGYSKGLDQRYGIGTADELLAQYKAYKESDRNIKDWKKADYEGKIRTLPSFMAVDSGVGTLAD